MDHRRLRPKKGSALNTLTDFGGLDVGIKRTNKADDEGAHFIRSTTMGRIRNWLLLPPSTWRWMWCEEDWGRQMVQSSRRIVKSFCSGSDPRPLAPHISSGLNIRSPFLPRPSVHPTIHPSTQVTRSTAATAEWFGWWCVHKRTLLHNPFFSFSVCCHLLFGHFAILFRLQRYITKIYNLI